MEKGSETKGGCSMRALRLTPRLICNSLIKFMLSPGGFATTTVAFFFVIHGIIILPMMSYHWWGWSVRPLLDFIRELIGMTHVPTSILQGLAGPAALSPEQVVLLKAVYASPDAYLFFMRLYLGLTVVFFYLCARFIYYIAIHPIACKVGRLSAAWPTTAGGGRPGCPDFRYQLATGARLGEAQPLELLVGLQHQKKSTALVDQPVPIRLGLHSLRTGLIVTGTTGTGKTYGALYSYTRQFLHYRPDDPERKPGILILDVKGNYCNQVLNFVAEAGQNAAGPTCSTGPTGPAGRMPDVIIIEIGGQYRYNPLHKPLLRPQVLANRLRVILETFSVGKNHDTYWLDKAEFMIAEAIKLARLVRGGYVTFEDIDRLIRRKEYQGHLEQLARKERAGLLSPEEVETYHSVRDFFTYEFEQSDERVRNIIESEVTRMTATFTTDPDIRKTFCAPQEELNFPGFDDLVDHGKIVILRMNAEEYQNLAKIVSTYLKLDFQSAVMTRLVRPGANRLRPLIFINDEYHFMASRTDSKFFSVCREADCVNVVATQSFTSLVDSLGDKTVVETILQNLVNKIWLRGDDHDTIEAAQRATGKEIKFRRSESLTESGKNSNYSWMFGRSVAKNSNLSKSVNYQAVEEHTFPYDLFRQELRVMQGVAFLYLGGGGWGNDRGNNRGNNRGNDRGNGRGNGNARANRAGGKGGKGKGKCKGIKGDILTTVIHLIPFDHFCLPPRLRINRVDDQNMSH